MAQEGQRPGPDRTGPLSTKYGLIVVYIALLFYIVSRERVTEGWFKVSACRGTHNTVLKFTKRKPNYLSYNDTATILRS
jgi:hypothetical protein